MAEGGVYPWKIQKVEAFGPTADYSNLSKPLPSPPDGMVWDQDVTTKEWKLISSPEQKAVVPKNEENKETLNDDIDVLKQMAREEEKQKERQKSAGPTHIQHIILPTDTLAGICLKYKISAVKVRQINRFSGSNLHLAPNPLIIPIVDPQLLVDGVIKVQNTESREFKRGAFRARFLSLRDGEITSYLEMNNWDLEAAMQNAKDDIAWEKSQQQPPPPPKKELEDISSLALEAHIAIPVTTTTTSVKKKKKNIELELGSVTAKKQEQRNPLTTTKKQMKGLFRPLLPR
uniref:LysM domain-containing protein n=1 Tax=Ditylum brightwellii TaxID=49249 RepID=A0A7S4QUU5_9STRA